MFSYRLSLLLLLASSTTVHVNAHGYLESPRSRNYVANQEGKAKGDGDETTPLKETATNNARADKVPGQCGTIGDRNYECAPNVLGGCLPTNIQATYTCGEEIEVTLHIDRNHGGHFLFSVCEEPTYDCFKDHRLEYVRGVTSDAPKDFNYPYRAYMPPKTIGVNGNSWEYKFMMKLPDDVSGDSLLLQWWWVTADGCDAPGYDKYAFPDDWNMELTQDTCEQNDDMTYNHKQFSNCAEVKITGCGQPIVSKAPVASPNNVPTMLPTSNHTSVGTYGTNETVIEFNS